MADLHIEGNAGANLLALSAAVPATLFAALMPPVTDLWVTKNGTVTTRMVRETEILVSGVSLAIAVVLSAMVGSHVPLTVTLLVTVLIVAVYEYILRRDILSHA